MEILNNIWTALSTPNEGLMNVIMAFASIIEATLILFLFISILDIQATKFQKILYIVLSSVEGLLTMNFIPEPFNVFVNYAILFFIIYKVFNLNFFKTLLALLIPNVAFALIGTLILNAYLTITNINYEQLLITPIYRITYLLIMYLIILFLIFVFKYKKLEIHFFENLDKKTKNILIITLSLGLFTIALQLYITAYNINILPILISILSFICLLSYFYISIYSITRIIKLNKTYQQLESAEEYNRTLRILHDNVRCFKHDFDNIVTTIGGFVKTNDMKGLKQYYSQLEKDCQKVNNLYVLNPEIINNNGIYNLLMKKYHEAEAKNVDLNLTFLLDLNSLRIQIYDFAKILGILLDNAIEASSECKERLVNIIFRNDEKNSRQLLIIENTYKDKNVDLNKIFDKGVTGKENHTGLGLWEIRQILKRNNNLNLHTTKNDNFFTQQFEIYYEKQTTN